MRRFLVMRVYISSAVRIIAMKPIFSAEAFSMPKTMHRLVTRLLARNAVTMSKIGRMKLYLFKCH